MKLIKNSLVIITPILMLGCGGGGGGGSDDSDGGSGSGDITVTDSASLSQASSFDNGNRIAGNAPIPAGASAAAMEGPGELPLTTNSVSELARCGLWTD